MKLTKDEIIFFLKQTPIFSDVSTKGIKLIAANVEENIFRKGQIIFNEGEKGSNFYIINKGIVKIVKWSKQGRNKTLAILKEKDNFGEMAILTNEGRSATVEALTEVTALSISGIKFEQLIRQEPSISLQIIKTLSGRLAKADRHIKNLALGNARSRVANILLDFKGDFDKIKLTHQEMAALAGITRETTTRILKQMQSDKIIHTNNRQIKIENLEKLEEIAL